MSSALRERGGSEQPVARPQLSVVPRPRRLPGPKTILAGIYVLAFAYHWLQSRAHVSPAVFGDELLYSKLAQSVAAGDGFSIRGETVFFPAPLAILAQAPAWLLDSTSTAYGVVKAMNAAFMAAAALPAYFLARRLVRPSYALLAAAAAVAGPAMLYAPYLMSEALAYPVFLLALATMLRAIERPSRRMELAVVAVSLAAVLTRLQLVVLPLAYLLAVPVSARLCGESIGAALRRHRLSLGLLVLLGALPLATGGAVLGTYSGATLLEYDLGATVGWSARTASLLPFGAGLLIVPGALLGLGLRPRGRAEAAFATLAIATIVLVLLEVGLIAAADAGHELERYAIYLVPLLAIAFFVYAERGAPWRRAYVGLALAGAATAWLMPFPARAGTTFTFDAPTFSVYGQLAAWWGHANAATVFAGLPLLAGIALACVSLRRSFAPVAVGVATIAVLLLSGVVAYAGEHKTARGTLEQRAGDPPDWLDRSGLGPADYLQLPGGSPYFGWLLEAWNRDFRRPVHLGAGGDWFASSRATIGSDGRLLVDGASPTTKILVVNNYATAIELDGEVVARPRDGLTAYRLPAEARVRGLAVGLTFDRWAETIVSYRVWPKRPTNSGTYHVTVALPAGSRERRVTFTVGGAAPRTLVLAGDASKTVEIPARGYPVPTLRITTDQADSLDAGTPNARLVAVRIPRLSYRTND
jgi:hypothetical protein